MLLSRLPWDKGVYIQDVSYHEEAWESEHAAQSAFNKIIQVHERIGLHARNEKFEMSIMWLINLVVISDIP